MFKFNGGDGAVVCDKCRTIIDSGLSYKEYEESYGIQKCDLCTNCASKDDGKDARRRVRKGSLRD